MRVGVFWTLTLVCVGFTESVLYLTKDELSARCEVADNILFTYIPTFKHIAMPGKDLGYICAGETPRSKYVSVFSRFYGMSLYSAAVIEEQSGSGKWTRNGWKADDVEAFVTDEDYSVFHDFQKGHLLPHALAKDQDQADSMNRYSNAVPQDALFNNGVWREAERQVRETLLPECRKRHGLPILVVGAVPKYFGADKRHPEVKIGQTESNVHYTFRGNIPNSMQGEDDALHLTVPTHMWTQFVCHTAQKSEKAHISYIGLNYKTGIVKVHDEGITDILKLMYKRSIYSYEPSDDMEEAERNSVAWEMVEQKSGVSANKLCLRGFKFQPATMSCAKNGNGIEGNIWAGIDVYEERRENEMRRAFYVLSNYGVFERSANLFACPNGCSQQWSLVDALSQSFTLVEQSSEEEDMTMDWQTSEVYLPAQAQDQAQAGTSAEKRPRVEQDFEEESGEQTSEVNAMNVEEDRESKRRKGSKRRKRSIEETPELNVKIHMLGIIDNDSSSDFKLKDCRIWEESGEGEVVETHVYDFENNTLIEDWKTSSGSTLTATYTDEDGVEVPADKEPALKVSKEETITIVLRPR